MKIDDKALADFLYKEIFVNDTYQLKPLWASGFRPTTILDIGANNGFFALYARVLFPSARLICLEPAPETFKRLTDNVENLGVELYQLGLGDGTPITLVANSHTADSGSYVGKPSPTGVPTIRFDELCRKYNLDVANSIVKIDCEGAERFILDHKPSIEMLAKARRWMMEVHYHHKLWPECPRREVFEQFWRDFERDYKFKLNGPFKRHYGIIVANRS